MKQVLVHKIDLLELEGEGGFLCPFCGATISPDDETEDAYSVLEAKVRKGRLENVFLDIIYCGVEQNKYHFGNKKKLRWKSYEGT